MLGVSEKEVQTSMHNLRVHHLYTEADLLRRLWKENEMMAYELRGMSSRKPWARASRRET